VSSTYLVLLAGIISRLCASNALDQKYIYIFLSLVPCEAGVDKSPPGDYLASFPPKVGTLKDLGPLLRELRQHLIVNMYLYSLQPASPILFIYI
jgi:hypothetical protein